MITPADIRSKAERAYPKAVQAWLAGDDSFFPYRMPADLSHPESHADLIAAVEALRADSKERRGFGYSIRWEEIQSRQHGKNHYPRAILFESFDDLVRCARKLTEVQQLKQRIDRVRERFPTLDSWLIRNWRRLLQIDASVEELLDVTAYVVAHPRPDCFTRELPLSVSTKVVERNQAVLREWLDMLLAPTDIEHGTRHFEQRYGFRYVRSHLLIRLLDEQLQCELGFPAPELSLPSQSIADLPVRDARVFVLENKVNALTLPSLPRSIAFGGLGDGVTQLFKIDWLRDQQIFYWGDIDLDGFDALDSLRREFPHVRSLFMDIQTLTQHRALATHPRLKNDVMEIEQCESTEAVDPSADSKSAQPSVLTADEFAAFRLCQRENLRLEQEHIAQSEVIKLFDVLFGSGPGQA